MTRGEYLPVGFSVVQETMRLVFTGEREFEVGEIRRMIDEKAGRKLPGGAVYQTVVKMDCVQPNLEVGADIGDKINVFDPRHDGTWRCRRCAFANGNRKTKCPRYMEAMEKRRYK